MNSAKTYLFVLFICTAIATHAAGPSSRETSAGGLLIGKEAGQLREDNGLAMKFVWCPPGSLTMEQIEVVEDPVVPGPDVKGKTRRVEKMIPVKVSLSQGFWLARCEVSQAEWQRVMQTTLWNDCPHFVPDQGDIAAVGINWFDAMEFDISGTQIIRHVHIGYSPTLREDIIEAVEGLLKRG